jgi:hypothetical protein
MFEDLTESVRDVPIAQIDEMTQAGLVGSIDHETKTYTPALAWTERKGVLIMDEFSLDRTSDAWNPLLQLMEGSGGVQHYAKKIARFSAPIELHDPEGDKDSPYYFIVKDGEIKVTTRFAVVFATMRPFESILSQKFQALISRTIPYRFKVTDAEMVEFLAGKSLVNIHNYSPELEVQVSSSQWKKVYEFVHEELKINKYDTDTMVAMLGRASHDIIRAYAVEGYFDWQFAKIIINCKADSFRVIGKWRKAELKGSSENQVEQVAAQSTG